MLQLLTSVGPFIAGCVAMYVVLPISYLLTLALALPTGALLIRVFIVQHDCGHGSFFASRRANALAGRLCSLCTLTPYANWSRQHSVHHADWNNLHRTGGGTDMYSACLTMRDYFAMSRRGRLLYRLPRHPLIANLLLPPVVFLLVYRLPLDTPRHWRRERRSVHFTNAALAARASAGHGRRLDSGYRTILGAAPFRNGALDGEGKLELCRSGPGGLFVASPAVAPAVADRQYRLPPRAPPQSARAKLPTSGGPYCRAGHLSGAADQPARWHKGATVDPLGRGCGPLGTFSPKPLGSRRGLRFMKDGRLGHKRIPPRCLTGAAGNDYSRTITFSSEECTLRWPLYSMSPSLRNLFMK